MTPTYEIITGDALVELPKMASGSVDAIVMDPPYGVGEAYTSFSDTKSNVEHLVRKIIPVCRSIAPVMLLTPGNGNQYIYPEPDWTLAWVERAGAGQNRWGFTCWQPVLAYGKSPYRAAGLGARPDIFVGWGEKSAECSHPCPKPLGVMRWMVEQAAPHEGMTILDPFCGSGTTGVACLQTGRNFIGIEIDPKYADIARARCAAEAAQGKLFAGGSA